VEHACQQCGAAVEDGRPFCPQCRAPQIHVQIALPDAGSAAFTGSAADELSPDILQAGRGEHPMLSGPGMESKTAVRAAVKAGLLGTIISAIPLIGLVLTGALAVFFYRRKSGSVLPAALAARLGAAAGLFVFGVSALFAIVIVVTHSQQQFVDMLMQTLQRLGANTADPELEANLRAGFANTFTPSGQAVALLFAVVFSSIGGALASLFMGSRNNRV
jgi:hypothetical protein